MRVLLACSLGGSGHLTPVVNVARAVRRLGHEPLVLVAPSLADHIEATGLPYVLGDQPPNEVVDEVWRRFRAGPPGTVIGLIDRELFADHCTRAMLGPARHLRYSWHPDLIVRESCEYASAIVALEAGIPQAQVGISLSAIEHSVLEMVTAIIEPMRRGVTEAIAAAPFLTSFPGSLDPSPWPDTRRFRLPRAVAAGLPEWWPANDLPLIYVTFGSVIGHLREAAGVFRAALDAVSGLPARVLLTVGRATDVSTLAWIPENTHVEQWVAQDDVLDHAAVVVCHGGSGSVFGALAAGVPLVVCPMFADQSRNGRAVEEADAGVMLSGRESAEGGLVGLDEADVAPLREAIERVLSEPDYRAGAQQIAAELARVQTLDQTVAQLLASMPNR